VPADPANVQEIDEIPAVAAAKFGVELVQLPLKEGSEAPAITSVG
jgi:hypothetical protein